MRLEYLESLIYRQQVAKPPQRDEEAFDRLNALIQAGLGDVPQDRITEEQELAAIAQFRRPEPSEFRSPRPPRSRRQESYSRMKACEGATKGWETRRAAG